MEQSEENGEVDPSSEKRKPKSLYEPTESMLASQREFERRKNEIRDEDDPFWEKRGGKCGKHLPKFEDVPEKSPKTLKELAETVQPLPTNSRLLTPTQATIFASYHKEETPKEKHITALPTNSHLLTPTKASCLGEYHPPPKASPRTESHAHPAGSTSQIYSPPANSRLMELTTNRKCAAYEKKIIDNDPREDGWRSIIAPIDPKSPLPIPAEVPQYNNPYKNVKSKLHNPTVASVRQKWCDPHSPPEDGEELLVDHVTGDASHNGHSGSESAPVSPRSSARNHKRFSQIPSRLHEPTAAHLASQWCNRPISPSPSPPTVYRRHSSEDSDTPAAPAVQGKTTQAQIHGQRVKYVRPDDGDIAKAQKHPVAAPRGAAGGSRRSKSVPVYGRIYLPPAPPPPPGTERRASTSSASWRHPSPASSSHVNQLGEPASPFAALVTDVQTPLRQTGDREAESSAQDDVHDHVRGNHLSRLFPVATEAIELVKEETEAPEGSESAMAKDIMEQPQQEQEPNVQEKVQEVFGEEKEVATAEESAVEKAKEDADGTGDSSAAESETGAAEVEIAGEEETAA